MMMSFCKNTLHSFLGIPHHHHRDTLLPPPSTTTGLNSITDNYRKPPNIIESASVKPSSTTTSSGGSVGSLHEITSCCGGGSSLLNSCTESLGLESSEQMEEEEIISPESKFTPVRSTKKTRTREEPGKPAKKFPPILSSLRRHDGVGECKTSFLKPVRENGRLILTEVTINRPEVFRASRQDGRLRLQFIKREEKSSEKLLHENRETWPVKNGGGEGLWRCNEQNHHQQHYHHRRNRNQLLQMPLWNQQCVTSR